MPDIFSYTDYRLYLKDAYAEKKKAERGFNYRVLAKMAGFNSAGFFTNILCRRRNIAARTMDGLAKVFDLNFKEKRYFESLVRADQAKNLGAKKAFFDRASRQKKKALNVKTVTAEQYYDKWYYTAMRELVALSPKEDNPKALSKRLLPKIRPTEAARALAVLSVLGMIRKREDGAWEQTDAFITASQEVDPVMISGFQMQTAELGINAIDRIPRDRRNISTLTLGISREGYLKIIERLRAFRRELMEIAAADSGRDSVYHLNFHLFPLTRPLRAPK